MAAWRQTASQLEDWYRNRALPLWAAQGYDDARGGFYETLDFDGAPNANAVRRVRVQARQIHTFSQCALLGWAPSGKELATKGFDYFLAKACPDNGARGCVHHLTADGEILDDRRDLYDQAFLLLACASYWQIAEDPRALALAERTIDFLNAELASPHGGWLESNRGETPRRQNPHMHLFEAFMALYRATGDNAYAGYAKNLCTLFEKVFYDSEERVLREFFTEDFSGPDPDKGGLIEPGHMMEWVWLLGNYDALFDTDHLPVMQQLYMRAEAIGRDEAGFLSDNVSLVGSAAGPRRLWPQTEYIKAAIMLAKRGETGSAEKAGEIIDKLFQTYLNETVPGLWCDQFAADGAKLAKDVPASILYHLFEAVADTAQYAR